MKVDGSTASLKLDNAIDAAKAAEAAGYDGMWTSEMAQDPFLPLVLAAEHTKRVEIGTGLAVGFARNPMTLAQTAYDLQKFSKGRFIMGLGSQVKPHITRRYSMEWSHPAPRMREMISAIKHILGTWQGEHALDFQGEFYTHTLMTPYFDPGPNPYGQARIFVGGIGEHMTRIAGEVADGFLCHGFTTESYLRDVTRPTLQGGLEASGRSFDQFAVSLFALVATGETAEGMADAIAAVRRRIAFYASTPAYRPVLDHHGWGDLQPELTALSKQERWDDMGGLIDETMLNTFAVVAEPSTLGQAMLSRFGDAVDRLSFYAPYECDPQLWANVTADIKGAAGSTSGQR